MSETPWAPYHRCMLTLSRSLQALWLTGFVAISGCANEVSFGGAGNGGAGGVTSSGSPTTSQTTSSQPTGSTTTSEPQCPEWPCKLTAPQCGCESGLKCTVDVDQKLTCLPEAQSPSQAGQPCNDDCAAALICLPGGEQPALCHRFCESDDDCDLPGGRCVYDLTNDGVPDACTINCDPVSSTGCPGSETMCTVVKAEQNLPTWASECVVAGSKGQGEPCLETPECATGHFCATLNNGKMCLRFCNVKLPVCPPAAACVKFTPKIVIGAVEYGACVSY